MLSYADINICICTLRLRWSPRAVIDVKWEEAQIMAVEVSVFQSPFAANTSLLAHVRPEFQRGISHAVAVCLGTKPKPNCVRLPVMTNDKISFFCSIFVIYAFQVGLQHISIFLYLFLSCAHVLRSLDVLPWLYSGTRLNDRYFTHARLLDDGGLWDNDKMFILKAFTPLQAPDCLTLAQIDS